MPELHRSETAANLVAAFTAESRASLRYSFFAQQADVEGRPEVAALFRAAAESEAGHAHGHLDYLIDVGDPETGGPIGDTDDNLRAAVTSETDEADTSYPAMADTARAEGFGEIAEWLDGLAAAERTLAERFQAALERTDQG